jgi:hypothetical protein
VVRKGDVVLVDGDQRVSEVIKYLTQSSWSHAALYVGDELLRRFPDRRQALIDQYGIEAEHMIVEALMEGGVIASPLVKYADMNLRVCRPRGLQAPTSAASRRGRRAARLALRRAARPRPGALLLPVSLIPRRLRRKALEVGGGLTTDVICSSMIGRAFQNVGFPILPAIEPARTSARAGSTGSAPEDVLPGALPPPARDADHAARLRPVALLRRRQVQRGRARRVRLQAHPLGVARAGYRACARACHNPRMTTTRESEIRSVIERYAAAWRDGDLPTIIDCYHDDLTLHWFGANALSGDHAGRAPRSRRSASSRAARGAARRRSSRRWRGRARRDRRARGLGGDGGRARARLHRPRRQALRVLGLRPGPAVVDRAVARAERSDPHGDGQPSCTARCVLSVSAHSDRRRGRTGRASSACPATGARCDAPPSSSRSCLATDPDLRDPAYGSKRPNRPSFRSRSTRMTTSPRGRTAVGVVVADRAHVVRARIELERCRGSGR